MLWNILLYEINILFNLIEIIIPVEFKTLEKLLRCDFNIKMRNLIWSS